MKREIKEWIADMWFERKLAVIGFIVGVLFLTVFGIAIPSAGLALLFMAGIALTMISLFTLSSRR